MRTGVLARWPSQLARAKVALRCLENGLLRRAIDDERASRIANLYHVNCLVRATIGAHAAADARAIVDAHGAIVDIARNRPGRAANHAHRVDAVHTRIGHHHVVMLRSLANEARVIVVRRRARPHAIVAASAAIQVDQHRLRAVEKTMIAEKIEQPFFDFGLRIWDCGVIV